MNLESIIYLTQPYQTLGLSGIQRTIPLRYGADTKAVKIQLLHGMRDVCHKNYLKRLWGKSLKVKKRKRFAKPNTVVEVTIEVGTEPLKLASEFTPNELRRTELFVRGTEPTEVSEEYEDMELEAPFNLKAVNHTPGIIDLSWDYNMPEEMEEGEEILFEVSVQVDDGEALVLTTTADQQVIVTDIESGKKIQLLRRCNLR